MKAIILFSGGVDSTVMLAKALSEGKICIPISFEYGQKHAIELECAKRIAEYYQVKHHLIHLPIFWKGHSSLTSSLETPRGRTLETIAACGIPSTYVPARNTLFLAYATGLCETLEADEIHFGCNRPDRNNYPDCTPDYLQGFQSVLNQATRQAVEGKAPKLVAPLSDFDKQDIIQLGQKLKAPLHLTWSCYSPLENQPCTQCDACVLRIASGL